MAGHALCEALALKHQTVDNISSETDDEDNKGDVDIENKADLAVCGFTYDRL